MLLVLGLSGCMSNTATNMPTPLPIIQERPNFVLDVAPREGMILTTNMFEAIPDPKDGIIVFDERLLTEFENISAYRSLVCLNVDNIAEVGDDFSESSEIVSRVTMYVDNQKIENIHAAGLYLTAIQVVDTNGQVLMQGIGPKSICGKAHPLGVGVHEVLFQFRQTSGNILEYRWLFGLEES
jgi:hypothetical protein